MSPKQHKLFYLRHWSPCARACQWNTQAGIWGPGREPYGGPQSEDAQRLAQVVAYANQIARAQHRGPKSDDFRHACHILALGQNKSSLDLTNDECQRIVDLFNVLARPDDLNAVMDWADPLRSKKRNLIIQARAKAPEAYIKALLKDYHVACLEDLSIDRLRKLCFTLNQRQASWTGRTNHQDTKTPGPAPLVPSRALVVPPAKPEYVKGPF